MQSSYKPVPEVYSVPLPWNFTFTQSVFLALQPFQGLVSSSIHFHFLSFPPNGPQGDAGGNRFLLHVEELMDNHKAPLLSHPYCMGHTGFEPVTIRL